MICEYCGGELHHRDYVKRVVKSTEGQTSWIEVERVKCKKCGRLKRLLPDNLIPYKHYEKDVIEGVIDERITPNIIGYEDYPCEMSMTRWKKIESLSQIKEYNWKGK